MAIFVHDMAYMWHICPILFGSAGVPWQKLGNKGGDDGTGAVCCGQMRHHRLLPVPVPVCQQCQVAAQRVCTGVKKCQPVSTSVRKWHQAATRGNKCQQASTSVHECPRAPTRVRNGQKVATCGNECAQVSTSVKKGQQAETCATSVQKCQQVNKCQGVSKGLHRRATPSGMAKEASVDLQQPSTTLHTQLTRVFADGAVRVGGR